MKDGIHGLITPIINHKAPTLSSLQGHHHPEVDALIAKLEEWRILPLMTFKHNWNTGDHLPVFGISLHRSTSQGTSLDDKQPSLPL
jgi:hypothetical protein